MLNAAWLLTELRQQGVGCMTGVPCSLVSGLYTELEHDRWPYVAATSEGEAVAVAAGAWLGGSLGLALCQNSGLGNMTNPLSTLVAPFRIPLLLGVSRRGWPPGTDEPQHALMGEVTLALLELLRVCTEHLDAAEEVAATQLRAAVERCHERRASALVIGKGTIGAGAARPRPPAGRQEPPATPGEVRVVGGGRRPLRGEVLEAYLALADHRATVATTGYTARELYALDDRDSHFYMTGSMGCAPAIATGVAAAGGRPVTVLDGDGALLMRMGTLATVGRYASTPFAHVVLDNGQHESTGGQATNGAGVDFASVALSCGYRAAWRCEGAGAVHDVLREALEAPAGPVLVHCLVRPGTPASLPRPHQPLPDMAERFRTCISESPAPAAATG